ncbi:MAG TPA: hypothetical protein PKZ41_00435, partial [Candidatus Omnitrophota bacterium]|nr:hypothetical protein [Candidatus Omnitrophota bacterium]
MYREEVSKKILSLFVAATLLAPRAYCAEDEKLLLKEAEKALRAGRQDEALEIYRELDKHGSTPDLSAYNAGVILYGKGEYSSAISFFTKCLVLDDRTLERDALFGIANSYYRLSENAESTSVESSILLCEKAIGYYRMALEIAGRDREIRVNYETALLRKKALGEKRDKVDRDKGDQGKKKGDSRDDEKKKQDKKDNSREREQQKQDERKEKQRNSEDERKEDSRNKEDDRKEQERKENDRQKQEEREKEDKEQEESRKEEDRKKEEQR